MRCVVSDSTSLRRVALGVATLVFALLANADETRVIQLKHRSAAEVIPVVQPLMGPNDALTGMDYRLIVRTSERNFLEIERLLAQIDTARKQFRITVQQAVAQDAQDSHVGVSGDVQTDNVRIQLPRQSAPDNRGAVIQKNGVRLETRQTRTTSNTASTQFITALEGTPAFVRVGQSFPVVQRILALTGKDQIVLAQGVSYHDVITGFDVIAQSQGENVLLQITPRLSSMKNPTTRVVSFQEYSTTVVVRPGEWVDIGGLSGTGQDVRRAILDSAAAQSGERRTIQIKVD